MYENWSHFWDIFKKRSNNIFKTSSYMQKMTSNPIITLEITFYNTKHTNNTKINFRTSPQIENITRQIEDVRQFLKQKDLDKSSFYLIIYLVPIIHILYIS